MIESTVQIYTDRRWRFSARLSSVSLCALAVYTPGLLCRLAQQGASRQLLPVDG